MENETYGFTPHLIEGGIKSRNSCDRDFLAAYITDTRLMGAMGMFIHWRLKNCRPEEELIQFFYFDTEDLGLENYISMWEYDREKISLIEQTSIGCLGGRKIPLTEKEACLLVQHYHSISVDRNRKLPQPEEEYRFILDRELSMSEEEEAILISKVCTHIRSPYQLINYFLMRFTGNDLMGITYLVHEDFDMSSVALAEFGRNAYFAKNTISDISPDDGWYRCESVINDGKNYAIYFTRVQVTPDLKVSDFIIDDVLEISLAEAAMILNRKEYISVLELTSHSSDDEDDKGDDMPLREMLKMYQYSPEVIEKMKERLNSSGKIHGTVSFGLPYATNSSLHRNGQLIMAFRPDNNHVDSRVFHLNNDVIGTVFITGAGQLVLSSYYLRYIMKLEDEMLKTCNPVPVPAGQFTFADSVMQDFIDSDFDDFLEFMRFFGIESQ